MKRYTIRNPRKLLLAVTVLCLTLLGVIQDVQANEPLHREVGPFSSGNLKRKLMKQWGGYGDSYQGSIGLQVGTYGLGAHYFKPFGQDQQFGIRLGVGFMPLKTTISGTYSERDTESKVKASFNNADIQFNWFPLKSQDNFLRYFNVNVGALYLFKLDGELETRLKEDYFFGEIPIKPEDVGVVNTTVHWDRKINPAVGLGLNNMLLNDYLGLSVNLGCAFLSSPKVDMTANGLLINNTGNAATIQDNMKNYRYLPKLEIGISYIIW